MLRAGNLAELCTLSCAASGQEEKPSGLAQLSGTWRLVYSSGFASGGVEGRQPGPPAGLLPGKLGQVYHSASEGIACLQDHVTLGRTTLERCKNG